MSELNECEPTGAKAPKKCNDCGYPVLDMFNFCPNCGKKFGEFQHHIIKDKCSSCGFDIQSGDTFCENCGEQIKK